MYVRDKYVPMKNDVDKGVPMTTQFDQGVQDEQEPSYHVECNFQNVEAPMFEDGGRIQTNVVDDYDSFLEDYSVLLNLMQSIMSKEKGKMMETVSLDMKLVRMMMIMRILMILNI